jgi:pyruvate,water dikinase
VFEDKPWREDVRIWESEVRPASTRANLDLQARDPAAQADAVLGALLVDLHGNARHQYYLHHRFTISAFAPVGDLLAHAKEWTGFDYGQVLQAVRQPKGVVTDATERFDDAVREIRADAAARAVLDSDGPSATTLDALAARDGASGAAVRAWLERTGHRLVTGYDISDLVALEMPELLVRTLRASLAGRGERERVEADRAAAAARVRDAVPAAHREVYDGLLAEALSISNLREERALVCDFWAFGLVRRAVKDAGRRLADRGRIEMPLHVFDASHTEMLALVLGTGGPDAADLAARYRYRTTTTTEIAPPRLGFPQAPPPPPDWYPPGARRMNAATNACIAALFDEPVPRNEAKIVRGLHASTGVYEGPARVVVGPDDFARIHAGDVLVARLTTEAYNGIIPLLGAIVTDRGGLLSHAATVAREFGIPAVVGTKEATKLVPDGAPRVRRRRARRGPDRRVRRATASTARWR